MSHKSILFSVALAVSGVVALGACGSSSSSGGSAEAGSAGAGAGAMGGATSAGGATGASGMCATPGSQSNATCDACVEQNCASQFAGFCAASCPADSMTAACTSALLGLTSCIEGSCASVCNGSGAGGAGSGGETGTGGSGAATAPNCVLLAQCCTMLPSNIQGACEQSAGYNNDAPCANLLKAYQDGGQCTSVGLAPPQIVTCDSSTGVGNGTCISASYPAAQVATQQMTCVQLGGMVITTACPTANLVGCCTTNGQEFCYYTQSQAGETPGICTQSGGTWSTTP